MANPAHLEILARGADAWNDWRRRESAVIPDLGEARLVQANLERAILDRADLRHADLSKAQLSHASLEQANLEGATLILADLLGAVLNGANLEGASFFGAFLFGTRMKSARLRGANLLGASLMGADLSGADLGSAHLMSANFHEANLSGATLTGADLTAASLVGTRVEGAVFDGCLIHGISAWDLDGVPKLQRRLVITPRAQLPVAVEDLELAQLLNLVLYGKHLPSLLQCDASRLVLILGRFRGVRAEVSGCLGELLKARGLAPVWIDLDRPAWRDGLKSVMPLFRVARTALLDFSGLRGSTGLLDELTRDFQGEILPLVEGAIPADASSRPARSLPWVRYSRPSELESPVTAWLGRIYPES
jgi:uncharacterized protein YjbI with pentapeptide repeats